MLAIIIPPYYNKSKEIPIADTINILHVINGQRLLLGNRLRTILNIAATPYIPAWMVHGNLHFNSSSHNTSNNKHQIIPASNSISSFLAI